MKKSFQFVMLSLIICLSCSFLILYQQLSTQFTYHFDNMKQTFSDGEVYLYNMNTPNYFSNLPLMDQSTEEVGKLIGEEVKEVYVFPGKLIGNTDVQFASYYDDSRLKNQCIYYNDQVEEGIYLYEMIDQFNENLIPDKTVVDVWIDIPTNYHTNRHDLTIEMNNKRTNYVYDGIEFEYNSIRMKLPIKGILDNKIWLALGGISGYMPHEMMDKLFKENSSLDTYPCNLYLVNNSTKSASEIKEQLQNFDSKLTALSLKDAITQESQVYIDMQSKYKVPMVLSILACVGAAVLGLFINKENIKLEQFVINCLLLISTTAFFTTLFIGVYRHNGSLWEIENMPIIVLKTLMYPIVIYAGSLLIKKVISKSSHQV